MVFCRQQLSVVAHPLPKLPAGRARMSDCNIGIALPERRCRPERALLPCMTSVREERNKERPFAVVFGATNLVGRRLVTHPSERGGWRFSRAAVESASMPPVESGRATPSLRRTPPPPRRLDSPVRRTGLTTGIADRLCCTSCMDAPVDASILKSFGASGTRRGGFASRGRRYADRIQVRGTQEVQLVYPRLFALPPSLPPTSSASAVGPRETLQSAAGATADTR